MLRLKHLLQRLLVLALGAVTVWLILVLFFDVADRRLPLVLALAATYGVAAYLIIPRAIRLGARLTHSGKVPSYTLTGDGLPGDPVNLALIGTFDELCRAFERAGWYRADPLSFSSSWKMTLSFVRNTPYPTAPFSTLFLFDRGQDVGFQQPIGDSPRKRHHVRFWGVSAERAEATVDTPALWFQTGAPPQGERAVWIGAVTRDTGLSLTRLSFKITHATDADTDAERDYVMAELAKCGAIDGARPYMPGERLSIGKVNRYVTDGVISVATLTPGA